MKKLLKTVVLFVIYFVLMFAPMFTGFLSPTLWFFYPVLSALISAAPLMWVASKCRRIGGVAMFPLVWYLLLVIMGELGFAERLITPLIIIIMAEIARWKIGYEKQIGIRIAYAISSLVTAVQHLIIWTRTDFYYEGAVEEMGSTEYADAITAFGTPGYILLLFALTFCVGYLGAIIAEKIFKNKVMVSTDMAL